MTHGDDLRLLLDLEEIRRLKYAYFRCIDTKDWPGLAACFVPEATATYPTQDCADLDAILAFIRTSLVPDLVTMHHGHHPEIRVDGDSATGTWYLHDQVYAPAFDFALEGAALYSDRYVRTPEGWRMSHTGYERIFEKKTTVAGATIEQGARSRGEHPA
ncbi:nuclear transport factor 2 family protein [Nocardioides allogilvus]|uniref:nuclear transport factor 2 family protein n=1 Tax=Nocardioides allogilvus TaxID=2072017 RepID=UPI001E5FB316|nr:nuclear transport factor 2 family protein [Nocardioides allogilvus]